MTADIFILSGYYRDEGGAVETQQYAHKTLAGAREHLKSIIEEDKQERPNEVREIMPDYYLSTSEFGEERFELSIDREKVYL